MTRGEAGMLMLCCQLGDPYSRPLTISQFQELGYRVRATARPKNSIRSLQTGDLTALGYHPEMAAQIVSLLNREDQLQRYLDAATRLGISWVTRLSPDYPRRISEKLRLHAPPALFYRGDSALLHGPSVAVIGSRDPREPNARFARRVGALAANEELVLVSGGCRGSDLLAQSACQQAGGKVLIFVPDVLSWHPADSNALYCSADGFDLPFTTPRALFRNHLIHTQGDRTLVAQTKNGKGGTWRGSVENLKHRWSPLFVFNDGSEGAAALIAQGAISVGMPQKISALTSAQTSFFFD